MRTIAALALLALTACSTGTPGATQTPTSQATTGPTGAGSTPTSVPTSAATASPAGGGQTVSVTLTGGPDAGTYTGNDNPNCSFGLAGRNTWGTQFSIAGAANDQLSSVQTVAPVGGEPDPDSMFAGTVFLLTVVIGPLFETGARTYEVAVYNEDSDKETSGSGSAQVTDNGATAVIHAVGTTTDGVAIDATVNCPSVTRA